jgi:hypothetical protein
MWEPIVVVVAAVVAVVLVGGCGYEAIRIIGQRVGGRVAV